MDSSLKKFLGEVLENIVEETEKRIFSDYKEKVKELEREVERLEVENRVLREMANLTPSVMPYIIPTEGTPKSPPWEPYITYTTDKGEN